MHSWIQHGERKLYHTVKANCLCLKDQSMTLTICAKQRVRLQSYMSQLLRGMLRGIFWLCGQELIPPLPSPHGTWCHQQDTHGRLQQEGAFSQIAAPHSYTICLSPPLDAPHENKWTLTFVATAGMHFTLLKATIHCRKSVLLWLLEHHSLRGRIQTLVRLWLDSTRIGWGK